MELRCNRSGSSGNTSRLGNRMKHSHLAAVQARQVASREQADSNGIGATHANIVSTGRPR